MGTDLPFKATALQSANIYIIFYYKSWSELKVLDRNDSYIEKKKKMQK